MLQSVRARILAFVLVIPFVAAACSDGGGATSAVGPETSAPEPPAEPVSLSSSSLSFDPGVARRQVRLVNPGPDTPVWRSETDVAWLSTAPDGGTLAVGETAVRIEVNRAALDPGTHQASVRFVVGQDALRADVEVEIPARAEAALDPDVLELGTSGSGVATLENRGDAPLTWSIESPSWITISQPSGELDAGETVELAIDADRSSLSPGTREATLRLSSNGGDDTLTVRVEVPEPPTLSINPTVLDFGFDRNSRVVSIENRGGSPLSWSASPDRSWVTIDAASGTVQPGSTVTRIIAVDRSSLAAGHHTARLRFDGNGGTAAARIETDVRSGPSTSPPPSSGDGSSGDGSGDDGSGSGDDGSGDDSSNDPPASLALSGRIVGQFDGAGLGGLTVSFAGQTVATAADGSFQVPGSESTSLRSLSISGSPVVDRETFARDGEGSWRAIPSTFDMRAFDDMAREFEPRTIRWTSDPKVYVDTRPNGFAAGPELDAWIQEVAGDAGGFASAWSDGRISVSEVRIGSNPPVDAQYNANIGWIVIRFSEDPAHYPSTNTIGVARTFWGVDRSILAGTITLRFEDFSGPSGRSTRRAVFGHELGHTFGMGHMDGGTTSLMTPSIRENGLTGFDRSSGSILYTRSPGNQHPDRDDQTFFRGGLAPSAAPTGSHGWVCGDPTLPRETRGR